MAVLSTLTDKCSKNSRHGYKANMWAIPVWKKAISGAFVMSDWILIKQAKQNLSPKVELK